MAGGSATGGNALAVGVGTKATNVNSTAIGFKAEATQASATAVGSGVNASGYASTALGYQSNAKATASIAIGSHANAEKNDGIAIGSRTSVTSNYSIALGDGAKADGLTLDKDAYLVGGKNIVGELNIGKYISLNPGDAKGERRITGVAAGATDTDAVNVSQLKVVNNKVEGLNQTVNDLKQVDVKHVEQINELFSSNSKLSAEINQLDTKLNKFDKHAKAGIASAIAIASLPQPIDKGYSMLSIGTGAWDGESSLALGASGITEDKNIFNKNVNYVWKFASTTNSQNKWGGGASVGVQWK